MTPEQAQAERDREQANLLREKVGLFRAGKIATWVWVVTTLVPIVVILLCCGMCAFGGVVGGAAPS